MRQLITTEYFKSFSTVDNNVPDKLIIMAIDDAQEMYLMDKIGYTLFNKILTDGIAGILVEPYLTLYIDFIIPYVLKATEYELVLKIILRETSQGLIKNKNDNTEIASIEDYRVFQKVLKEKVNILGDNLITYLKANSSSYPEYTTLSLDRENPQGNTMGQIYIDPYIQRRVNENLNYYFGD